jgi:hypothetical protein
MHEIFFENLRNPVRSRHAGLMLQFRFNQLDSIDVDRLRSARTARAHEQPSTKFSTKFSMSSFPWCELKAATVSKVLCNLTTRYPPTGSQVEWS